MLHPSKDTLEDVGYCMQLRVQVDVQVYSRAGAVEGAGTSIMVTLYSNDVVTIIFKFFICDIYVTF